jgi:hypothetical protein
LTRPTAAEYLAGRDIMAAVGLLTGPGDPGDPVRFAYYGLEEAPKDEVLGSTAKDRRLRAYLVNTSTGDSTDVVVSLTRRDVVSARRLDPRTDGQLPILDSDFTAVDEIVKADPDWRAAMARRGYRDLSQIRTAPITAGAFGVPDDDRRRMVRVLAFIRAREHDLAWAHPVDGVAAYVDLVEKKVFKITDEFELPVPAESGDYDDEALRGPHRTTLKPIQITQPEGASFTLDGHALRWRDPADPRVAGRPPRRRRPGKDLADHQHRPREPVRAARELHPLPGVRAGAAGRPRLPACRAVAHVRAHPRPAPGGLAAQASLWLWHPARKIVQGATAMPIGTARKRRARRSGPGKRQRYR